MSRRGRPRSDRLALVERIIDALVNDPELAAHARDLGVTVNGRESDVRRVVAALRKLGGIELPAPTMGRPKKDRPNRGSPS